MAHNEETVRVNNIRAKWNEYDIRPGVLSTCTFLANLGSGSADSCMPSGAYVKPLTSVNFLPSSAPSSSVLYTHRESSCSSVFFYSLLL